MSNFTSNITMKIIVITGATSGVGLAIARTFVRLGWRVIGLARNITKLQALKDELGENFDYVGTDISQSISVDNAFKFIEEKYASIDVLVNNAAVFITKPFSESTIEDIDQVVNINLKGAMYCTFNALKIIKPNIGRVINIGSVAGEHGIKNQSIYCASKFGLDGFSEALNQELLAGGVSITTISPGGINTPLWDADNNPYPGGDTSKLLDAQAISGMVENITNQPSNVVIKKIIVFPSNEWH